MNPYFSIIITAYNTPRKLLCKCMRSWMDQSYQNFELLLIDDGSDKETKKIFREYQKRMPMLKIIEQDHKGPGEGRNVGLKAACGEYIYLADSDDYVRKDMLKLLKSYLQQEPGLDIIYFNYLKSKYKDGKFYVADERNIKLEQVGSPFLLPLEEKNVLMTGFLNELKNFYNQSGQCWTTLIRKEFLKKYQIQFDPKLKISGDMIFNCHCLVHSKKIAYIPEALYFYVYNENSITNAAKADCDPYLIRHLKEIKKFELHFSEQFRKEFPFYIAKTYAKNMRLHYVNKNVKSNNLKSWKEWKQTTAEYRHLFGEYPIKKIFSQRKLYGILTYTGFKMNSYLLTKLVYRIIEHG